MSGFSKVVPMAITMPAMPNRFPDLAEAGDDKPFKARMKQIEAARYRRVDKLSVTVASRYFFFLNICSIRCVTIKPPKIFTEANITAKKPRTREKENTLSSVPSIIVTPLCEPTAITAPTTIIPEMALVTDIRGVCNAGVTFQTT